MTTATALTFPVVDADNHYYEPYDCFTRHIDPAFADRAIHAIKADDGVGRLYYGTERLGYASAIISDYVGAPGSFRAFFDGEEDGGGWRQRQVIQAHDYPPMMHRDARIALMDDQHIEACIMLPSLGVQWEPEVGDIPALYANLTAFNKWAEDDWGYAFDNRIFGVALMSLADPGLAVRELDRILALGARLIHLKAGPTPDGRSPADPVFDPFWARVNETGVKVVLHTGNFGYSAWFGAQWSEEPHPRMHAMSAFQWATCQNERPVADTLTAMILHNLFGRFPNVRVLTIENGSTWVGPLLKVLDKAAKMAGNGPWLGGPLADAPSAVFREHVYVSPFYEEDIAALAGLIGAKQVLFGSDYPHPEGLDDPASYADRIAAMDPESVRQIMRGNTARLLGLHP
jgi:predicted TIM-barrel fold metal-dependent hydrolase